MSHFCRPKAESGCACERIAKSMSANDTMEHAIPSSGLPTQENTISSTSPHSTASVPRVSSAIATSEPTTEWWAEMGTLPIVPVSMVSPPAPMTTSIDLASRSGPSGPAYKSRLMMPAAIVLVTRLPISRPPRPSKSAPMPTACRSESTPAPTVTPIALLRSLPAFDMPMPTAASMPTQKIGLAHAVSPATAATTSASARSTMCMLSAVPTAR
mmetsp:Transcript_12198/g.28455  ORF Transcript_12198/g.28455 Transcript_12198/m.28455 type:complete len:213 (-) Transcript_12198:2-640(-)